MDLNKTLREWDNKLKKEGFNTFPFTDGEEIVTLEISTKKFKANVWKEKDKLFIFVPFLNSAEKEIKDHLESYFFKIAEDKIKKLGFIDSSLIDLNVTIKPKPLYLKTIGMKVYVNSVEDVIAVLKKFGDIYENRQF